MSHQLDAVLLGYSGSLSAHPVAAEVSRAIRALLPDARIVCGVVFPTDHWRAVLAAEPQIYVVARGEGEETVLRLLSALAHAHPLQRHRLSPER